MLIEGLHENYDAYDRKNFDSTASCSAEMTMRRHKVESPSPDQCCGEYPQRFPFDSHRGERSCNSPKILTEPEKQLRTVVRAHRTIRNAPLNERNRELLSEIERNAYESIKEFYYGDSNRTADFYVQREEELIRRLRDSERTRRSSTGENDVCHKDYPSINGGCSYGIQKDYGKRFDKYIRIISEPAFCDLHGRGWPRCSATKQPLPNPRKITSFLRSNFDATSESRVNTRTTHLLNVAGQFITHSLVKTGDRGGHKKPEDQINCQLCENAAKRSCLVWNVSDDAIFNSTSRCHGITRSIVSIRELLMPGLMPTGQNRKILVVEHINQLTGTLTGGAIYGFDQEELDAIREPGTPFIDNGKFALGGHYKNLSKTEFLPRKRSVDERMFNISWFTDEFVLLEGHNDKNYPTRISGDTRVFENPYLGSVHIMFHRKDNQIFFA